MVPERGVEPPTYWYGINESTLRANDDKALVHVIDQGIFRLAPRFLRCSPQSKRWNGNLCSGTFRCWASIWKIRTRAIRTGGRRECIGPAKFPWSRDDWRRRSISVLRPNWRSTISSYCWPRRAYSPGDGKYVLIALQSIHKIGFWMKGGYDHSEHHNS